jgi:soluble lytic murein transglycosylase-like protein
VGTDVSSADLLNPTVNALAAGRYLKMQLDRYDGDWCKSVAAYNSGTYNPSKVLPGKPRNYKYIKGVKLLLDKEHRDFLICGPRKLEE